MEKLRPKIHPGFIEELNKLDGKRINSANCGLVSSQYGDFIAVELLIGDKRLCIEVAVFPAKGGRYFTLDKEAVDGAGVFPLPVQKKRETKEEP